jgi:hypothetical protein
MTARARVRAFDRAPREDVEELRSFGEERMCGARGTDDLDAD